MERKTEIRTRDPHLGKVFEILHRAQARPLIWRPVYGTFADSVRIQTLL
jgi:hypothetical protein